MKGIEIFRIWAPVGAKWVDWVRPVPFISINNDFKVYEFCDFTIPNINYIKESNSDTAVIVDLPGNESIKQGLGLAKLGFRPIPLYNGVNEPKGAMATTDNHSISIGLARGALEVKKMRIMDNAPPVFLLDSNRMNRFKMNVSVFDNSWDIYAHDMPSSKYFIKNGINKIIVRGECVQKDLNKILYELQKDGIKIFFTNGYEQPKNIIIKKSNYKN